MIPNFKEIGAYAYACARVRAMLPKLKKIPRETPAVLEKNVGREVAEFENKLISLSPQSVRSDIELFIRGKREVEALKIKFRQMYNQKRRSEGIRLLKASEYGEFVQEKVKNRMVELALDRAWFKKLRRTQLRDFVVRLEAAYMHWFEGRSAGKKIEFEPKKIIEKFASENPLSWGVILLAYYTKLEQIKNRRKVAWAGY